MRDFVLDENVVIEAVDGKKPGGGDAWAECEFMCGLLGSRDKICVNAAILEKYRRMDKKMGPAGPAETRNNLIYKGLAAMLRDSERVRYVDGVSVDHKGLKKCDREFVGVAVQSGAALVTSDGRLCGILDELHSEGTRIEYLDAGAALGRLGPRGGGGEGKGGG